MANIPPIFVHGRTALSACRLGWLPRPAAPASVPATHRPTGKPREPELFASRFHPFQQQLPQRFLAKARPHLLDALQLPPQPQTATAFNPVGGPAAGGPHVFPPVVARQLAQLL